MSCSGCPPKSLPSSLEREARLMRAQAKIDKSDSKYAEKIIFVGLHTCYTLMHWMGCLSQTHVVKNQWKTFRKILDGVWTNLGSVTRPWNPHCQLNDSVTAQGFLLVASH